MQLKDGEKKEPRTGEKRDNLRRGRLGARRTVHQRGKGPRPEKISRGGSHEAEKREVSRSKV